MHRDHFTRRQWLELASTALGLSALVPLSVSCATTTAMSSPPLPTDPLAIPLIKSASWDPIAFNRARGNAGAIPETYREKINGEDGATQHLGKHLPYLPPLSPSIVPAGMLGIMWGDPARGYAQHPNAPISSDVPTGHWYNWIRLRRAVDGEAEETESRFSAWPIVNPGDNGKLGAQEGEDPASSQGKNTVYFAAIPSDARPSDLLRVHAHCLTHGEYVDFVRLPG